MTEKSTVKDFDAINLDDIEAMSTGLRERGLYEEADALELLASAWSRTTSAYRAGVPFVPWEHRSRLHVVDYTIRTWGEKLIGTEFPNDKEVLEEVAIDEEWHRTHQS